MTFDEVRLLLGVDELELSDASLKQEMYSDELDLKLAEYEGIFDPDTETRNLAAQFDFIKKTASPTAGQLELKTQIRLYALYTVADQAAIALSMLAPKSKSDGKSTATRFSPESVYKDIRANIASKRSAVLRQILEALGINITDPSDNRYLGISSPTTDQVTNETT